MCYGGPIDAYVVFIAESKELFHGELCVVVRDNGVWDSKTMDDVNKAQHGLLRLDCEDQSSLYPLCKLVYGDKCVYPSSALLTGLTRSSPQTMNGHMMGIIWSAWAGRWVYRA